MGERGKRLTETVTIIQSQATETLSGATALVLIPQESGPIAFVVTPKTNEKICTDLQKAEAILRQSHDYLESS
jgi:hypothetical protein